MRTTDRTAAQAATDTADGVDGAGGAAEPGAQSHADDVGDEGRKATSSSSTWDGVTLRAAGSAFMLSACNPPRLASSDELPLAIIGCVDIVRRITRFRAAKFRSVRSDLL